MQGTGIAYSRYCDDLTFSGKFDTREVRKKAYGFLRAMGFVPNRKKEQVLSRHTRQTVTGLVVNEKAQTSEIYRRKLRQELHYCRQFGAEDHLRRKRDQEYLPDGEAGILRYLQSLLGRVNYVLETRPEDAWFKEAKEWLLIQS